MNCAILDCNLFLSGRLSQKVDVIRFNLVNETPTNQINLRQTP